MKATIFIVSAILALMSFAAASESETQPSTEVPVQKVHVLNPGEREYLSPNLVGLQNIAVSNIPVTIDFINVIDAYREVVDGVKYEILLNALNTTDNNTEIVCRIVVLEKPWLTTLWGDKVRLLKESNCTSEELLDNVRDRKSIEEKYETNAIFTGNRNELTADDMSKLESQILDSPKSPQLTRQQSVTTTTSTTTTTTTEPVASEDVTEPTNPQPEAEESVDNASATTQEAIISSSTEASSTTTTEKLDELSADEKKWLDDFLSIGAYNFEISHQKKKSESQTNEEQLSDQESDKRSTRQLAGGVNKLDAAGLQKAQQDLAKHLSILATGDGPSYTIDKVYSGTTQVVAGSLQKLDADLIDTKSGEKNRCTVSIWSRPWLQEDGHELTFECKNKERVVSRHSRSIEVSSRSKRALVGGENELDESDLKIEEEKANESLSKLAAGDGPFYTISKVFRGTKRIVAGTSVKLYVELIDDISGDKENCTMTIWRRLWLPVDGHEVTLECENKPKSVYRHSRSVEYAQKKHHKKSHRSLNKAEYLFKKFQVKYNKTYHNSMEHQMRMRIFKYNLEYIKDLNKHEMGSAKYGITEFADMTTTEYRERTGLLYREETNAVRSQASIPDIELPKEFDWREKGVVSPVKNQGNCGSCWAFSVTGNIEGLHAVKTGKLEEYSEQELLDCDTIDSACQGGLPDNAYQAIEKIGGLELESEYPYEGKKGSCHYNNTLARVKVSGNVDLPKNETAMAQWLIANGPISIGINANAMQFYRGGVSHPWKVLCSKSNLDHGVLIVGYGVSDYPMFKKTLPYWIVKNSWGPKWGEQGYYRVYRGDNTCGVSEMATSAVLA